MTAAACLAGAAGLALSGPAVAGLQLVPIDPASRSVFFTTEAKVDQVLQSGQRSGHDVFLRDGESFSDNDSRNIDWTSGATYRWDLSYDGDLARFVFADTPQTPALVYDISDDRPWGGFILRMKVENDSNNLQQQIFEEARLDIAISSVNGHAVSGMTDFARTLGPGDFSVGLGLAGGGAIASLSGTAKFEWEAGAWSKSPQSRFAFQLKALDGPVEVPLPATAGLVMSGLGLLAMRRRSSRRGV